MLPVLGTALGASLLGGLFSSKGQQPMIDPAVLRQFFGPQALAGDTRSLYRMLVNSPEFSALQSGASIRGQQIANQSQAGLAARGISGSGIGAFLGAAGQGLGNELIRQGQGQLFGQALQTSLQSLLERQNLYGRSFLLNQQMPTWQRAIGSSLLSGASDLFGNLKF